MSRKLLHVTIQPDIKAAINPDHIIGIAETAGGVQLTFSDGGSNFIAEPYDATLRLWDIATSD